MRIKFNLDRYSFLSLNVEGSILDVGCQDGSGWAHGHRMIGKPYDYFNSVPNITYFDLDRWSHPNFVRGDAHRLPFKDNSFDTVVSGDVLEHVPMPKEFLKELIRTARSKIIITTPDEYQWHKALKPFGDVKKVARDLGLTDDELIQNSTIKFKSNYAKCTDYTKEEKLQHIHHIRQFTPQSFIKLILDVATELSFKPESHVEVKNTCTFEINHFYHPLAPMTPEEPPDMAYWSCIFYKKET